MRSRLAMREPPLEVDADGVHARPRRSGHHWADLILAISAVTISVISLFVAIEHSRTEEELVTASTWPFLILNDNHSGGSGHRKLILDIRNAGVGPAHIESIVISLNGRPVHTAGELLADCCGLPAVNTVDDRIRAGEIAEGGILGVLPAREEIPFIGVSELANDSRLLNALDKATPNLSMLACYCSVLNRCWTTDLKSTTTPTPIAQCKPKTDDYHD